MSERRAKPRVGGKSAISIDVSPTDPNLRRIRAGGRVKGTLRASELDAASLDVGAPWDEATAARVASIIARREARERAMALLARRAHTSQEIRDRLQKRGTPSDIVESVVHELLDHGWLDDDAAARALAQSLARSGAGRQLIEARLESRGVNLDQARGHAREAVPSPLPRALEVAEAALRRSRSGTGTARAARIARALARKGFDDDTISDTLDRLGLQTQAADPEPDPRR